MYRLVIVWKRSRAIEQANSASELISSIGSAFDGKITKRRRWKLSTVTDTKLPNIHPGEVLLEEFMLPLSISQNALARAIHVPPRRINEIVLGKRAITADTALRLSAYFGNSAQFWMGLQTDYDLEEAKPRAALDKIAPRQAA